MKIAGLVTSVGYGDILRWTLAWNRIVFDHLLVVTAPDDRATQAACAFWGVDCLSTPAFRSDGNAFAKGRGINAGLDRLGLDGWIFHLDADIALPSHTRTILERAQLDPGCIYGLDRVDVKGFESWVNHLCAGDPQVLYDLMLSTGNFGLSYRVLRPALDYWVPIGFAQLWHPQVSGVTRYPEQHTDAARGDILFAANWPRGKRHLIPEIIAYHLESEPAPVGANWSGRRTKPFTLAAVSQPPTTFAPIDYAAYELGPGEGPAVSPLSTI